MNKLKTLLKRIFRFIFVKKKKKRRRRKIKNVTTPIMASKNVKNNNDMSLIHIDNGDGTNVLDVDLIDKNASDKDKKTIRTFTKKWVDIILIISLLDIQLVFVLAFMNKTQIAETLGVAIVTEVIGVFGGYLIKAFFESHSIAKNEIEMERIKHDYYISPQINSNVDNNVSNDDAVG